MSKRNIMLFLILIIIIITAVWVSDPFKRNERSDSNDLLFDSNIISSADNIFIHSREGEIVLEMRQEEWIISNFQDYPADPQSIHRLIENLSELKKGRFASKNIKDLDRFGLNQENAISVILKKGDKSLIEFNIGKSGPDLLSTFIKVSNEDMIRRVPGNIKYFYQQSLKNWRDRTLIDLKNFNIGELEIITEEYSLSIFIDENDNYVLRDSIEDRKLNNKAITDIINALKPLRADGFIEDEDHYPDIELFLDDPLYTLNITTIDKHNFNLYIVGKSPQRTRFYITDARGEYIKVLYSAKFERIFPEYDKILMDITEKAIN